MVVRCISKPVKEDIGNFFNKRANDLFNVTKLHHNLLKVEDVEWKVECPKCHYTLSINDRTCPNCEQNIPVETIGGLNRKKVVRNKRMKREDWDVAKIEIMGLMDSYEDLRDEFLEKCPTCGEDKFGVLFETIKCLPREVKHDLGRHLKNKANNYPEELKKETMTLVSTLQNRVAPCSEAGNPSPSWLKKRGKCVADLVTVGNIKQLRD